jgi:3-methylcrotonyl-CoA carboxylase alpha subunit
MRGVLMGPLFRKILIANRGEIAIRVARTCRAMGIPTVAVFSEADRGSPHARCADEAVPIGPADARESYLNMEAILRAAGATGADAIHPGYGFLSQNGDFADRVAEAGLTFIGPPGAVHRRMGDKAGARALMARAGVPVVPGYEGDDQSDATLQAKAARLGFPLMIKPSRGGGGKGMRVVQGSGEFLRSLEASRREARAAFGDDRVVLEKYLAPSRHIEVQVLADSGGRVLHLFERECSIQRRHQKVVEETPSPALDPRRRAEICAAGIEAARAAGYVNAGTVEFLLDSTGRFYFLEMNTRLQVEHAVTEMTTGLDLVALQIEVAARRPLGLSQEEVVPRGHSLECRLYAEDPSRNDLPSTGRILVLVPPEAPWVRWDGGIATGSDVGIHYDPMLAKVITWGSSRALSIARMKLALDQTVVLGVQTNQVRLRAILETEAFARGELHTGFLEEHVVAGAPPAPPREALAAAAASLVFSPDAAPPGGGQDPWATLGPWRSA